MSFRKAIARRKPRSEPEGNCVVRIKGNGGRMKKGSTRRFTLNPKKPPKTDWRAFDAMSAQERYRAAASDPDAQPATTAQLADARRVPKVRALRETLNTTK